MTRDQQSDDDETEAPKATKETPDQKLARTLSALAALTPKTQRALATSIRHTSHNSRGAKVDRRSTETVCAFLVALADKADPPKE